MRFAVLYFLGLVVSDLGTYFKHRNDPQYASLGASGAISAVLFAAIVYFPWMKLFIIPIPLPIPAPLFAVGYVAYSWWSARQARGRINHDAHLGGALFGLVFVLLTDPGGVRTAARLARRLTAPRTANRRHVAEHDPGPRDSSRPRLRPIQSGPVEEGGSCSSAWSYRCCVSHC